MSVATSSIRLAEAIAKAKAATAATAVIGSFDGVAASHAKLLKMRASLEKERARAEAGVAVELSDLFTQADALASPALVKRLVEADAVISPTGRKSWLGGAHRAATQEYNRILEAHAKGGASLLQADAARLVLAATGEAMSILGLPLEQHEKKRKERTAFRLFNHEDYPDVEVRRAIVLMALGDDDESAEFLANKVLDPVLDRDGRIACLLDARGDQESRQRLLLIASSILAHDAADYHVELARPRSCAPAAAAAPLTIGDRARASARDAA